MVGYPLAFAKTDRSGGFNAWCIPAPKLVVGGQINASNYPACSVVSVASVSGISDTSHVVVRLTVDGGQFSAQVPNAGELGCSCDFRPI